MSGSATKEAAASSGTDPSLLAVAARFPESYRGSFTAAEALLDARRVAAIGPAHPIAIDYYRHADQMPAQAALKIYHHGAPVALSRRVPVLENMGFRVISERTFEIDAEGQDQVFIHDMELENAFGTPIALGDGGKLFEDVFLSVWRGAVDNDGYNALVQTAGLWSRDLAAAMKAMRALKTGIVYLHNGTIGAEVHLPFGGVKSTGNGHREAGIAGIDFFSEWKTVYIDYSGALQRAQIDT